MLLSIKYNFLFVHIAKTAGTSVENLFGVRHNRRPKFFFESGCVPATNLGTYLDQETIRSYFKFAFVRNPWYTLLRNGWYTLLRNYWYTIVRIIQFLIFP